GATRFCSRDSDPRAGFRVGRGMAEYKLLSSSLRRFSAHGPPRLLGRQGNGISRLGPPGVAGRCHQLAQHLSRNLGLRLSELAHRRSKGPPKWRRHGEAGESLFQRLHPSPVRPFLRRWIEEEVQRHPQGEPKRKDSTSLGASPGLGEEREQGTGRGVPPVQLTNARTLPYTESGWM